MLHQKHCEKSKKLFGENGKNYHKWIDQYSIFGYRHRQVLHNKEGVEVGVMLFGEEARKHLEQHIRDDYDKEEIPTTEDLRGIPISMDGLIERPRQSWFQGFDDTKDEEYGDDKDEMEQTEHTKAR